MDRQGMAMSFLHHGRYKMSSLLKNVNRWAAVGSACSSPQLEAVWPRTMVKMERQGMAMTFLHHDESPYSERAGGYKEMSSILADQ